MKKTIILLFTVLSAVFVVHVLAGNYSKTCSNVELRGARLHAICKKANGAPNKTSINLDEKIGNIDGVLKWGDRDFSKSCSRIRLEGSTLTATCKKMNGAPNKTSINLDEKIDNTNGVLKFDRK